MIEANKKIGAGVIGLGVGAQHALKLASLSSCELRWLYDIDPEKIRNTIAKTRKGQAASSFEAILKDKDTDLVSIATYDDLHADEVVAALESGKHVFVEKPLARNREELKRIKNAKDRRPELKLGCNLILRAAPLYRWLKTAIASGELGEIYAFDGDYLYGRLEKITEGWRKDVKEYSVMQGGGVHLVDLMMTLTGQRPSSVRASGNRICTRGTDFSSMDFVETSYGFESGMVGRITANFGCVHRHQHVVRVFGTKGTFFYDDAGPRLHVSKDPASQPKVLDMDPLPASKGDLIPDFVKSILEKKETNEKHEFDLMNACLAADLALQVGEKQEIPYL